jgi:Ca2+-binding RTX toxin-like protein
MRAADDISSWRGGASNDSIRVQANNATIDSGAGDDVVSTYGHSTVDGGAGDDHPHLRSFNGHWRCRQRFFQRL